MKLRTRPIPLLAAGLVAGLTLVGCSGGSGGDATSIAIAVTETAAVQFDPALQDVNATYQLAPVYDTLFRQTSAATVEANVVTEWEYVTTTELRLTIRDDVVFSDGATLDSAGVKANLEAVQSKGGPYATSVAAIASIDTPDATTVVLNLSEPNPTLPAVLAGTAGMLVSPDAIDSPTLATTPVGSGPYVLEDAAPGQSYTYTKRDDYWNAEHYAYDTVELLVFADEASKLNALESGQIDVAEAQATEPVKALVDDGKVDFVRAHYNVDFMMLSDREGTLVPELADVRVRQAMNYAVDREAIAALAGEGNNTATVQLYKPGQTGYVESLQERYPYDPDKARELLADAGYADGFQVPMVSSSYFDQSAQALAGYLADVGIEVQITNVPLGDYIASVTGTEYPTSFFAYNMGDPYADTVLIAAADGTFNAFKLADPDVEAGIAAARESTTPEELAAGLEQVNTALVENAWFVPLYAQGFGIASAGVDGITFDVTRPAPLYDWTPRA